jgi:site-specific DNA-methyltransferase (adenine-specific)
MRLGPHTLLHGDCLALLPQLPAAAFDVIVTSPPYNLDLAYATYADRRTEQDYLDWMVQVCTELRRVLAADGSFFLNISGANSRPWLPFELIVRLRPLFVLQNHITWIKSIVTPNDSAGHYKPIGGDRFLNHNHEHIFHLTLTGNVQLDRLAIGVPFKDKSNIARRNHARDLRCRGNTWFIPYRTVQAKAEKFHHPGTFPVDLPRWCIRLHGKPAASVLDPFMGAGTTLVAAALESAAATGMDIDPAYVETSAARLRATLDQIESTNSQTTQASPAIQISERTLAALPK